MRCKKIFLYLFIILVPFIAKSKVIDSYGIQIGYTHSKVIPKDEVFETSWRPGLNVGFFAEKDIYKFIHSTIQLEYAGKGYRRRSIETDESGNVIQKVWGNTRLDYFSIPLFIKAIIEDIKYRPYIKFGPRWDYLFNFKRGVYEYSKIDVKDTLPDLLNLNSSIYGYSISLGCYLPILENKDITVEFRYNKNISKVPSVDNIFFGEQRSYYLSLGYTF